MNKTIEDMKVLIMVEELKLAKRQLESYIIAGIQVYENSYGLEVGCIDLFKNHTIGCSQGKTTSVKVEVKI